MEFKGTRNKWERVGTFVYALNNEGTNAFSLSINNDGKTPKAEQESNALLISKAPEMLEELIKEVEILKSMGLGGTERSKRKEQLIKEATEL